MASAQSLMNAYEAQAAPLLQRYRELLEFYKQQPDVRRPDYKTRYVCVWRGRELELQRMFKQLKRNLKASTNRSHNGELHETEDVPEEENAGPSRKKVALAASHRQQQRSEGLMLDNVLRALYHHHELDQDLVRSYVPLFLKLSGELRMTIGE